MATYTIVVNDALVAGLTKMLASNGAEDVTAMLTNYAVALGDKGNEQIQQANAQIMANALAQGMTPVQAAALIA